MNQRPHCILRTFSQKYLPIFLLMMNFFLSHSKSLAQHLLHHTRVENENRGINLFYTEIFKLFGDTYFTTSTAGYQRLKYGDEFLTGSRSDTLQDFNRVDQFIIKIDSTQNIIDYWVIDNCELYEDHTNTEQYSIMLINVAKEEDADSLAVMTMPDGTEIPRYEHLNESLLVITDPFMNYLGYRVPTTGRVVQLEGGQHMLYLGIEIPEGEEFILVGNDTVWNYQNSFGGYFPSIVIAAYDIDQNEFNWYNRFGSDYMDYLLDLKLDAFENIYMLIHPGGLSNYYADTIEITAGTPPYHNVLLKIDSLGQFQWAQNFEGIEGEYLGRLYIDHDDNPHVLGIFYGQIIHLFDTIFTVDVENNGRGILIKFNPSGGFEWGFILKGDYDNNTITNLDFSKEENAIYLTGYVSNGSIELTGTLYEDGSESQGTFLSKIDQTTGVDIGHLWFEGTISSIFHDVQIDNNGNPIFYLRFRGNKELLGYQLQSVPTGPSGFLLTLNTIWDTILNVKDFENEFFKIYPNPALINSTVNLEFISPYVKNLFVIDVLGIVVKRYQNIHGESLKIDLKGLAAGMYTIIAESEHSYQKSSIMLQ